MPCPRETTARCGNRQLGLQRRVFFSPGASGPSPSVALHGSVCPPQPQSPWKTPHLPEGRRPAGIRQTFTSLTRSNYLLRTEQGWEKAHFLGVTINGVESKLLEHILRNITESPNTLRRAQRLCKHNHSSAVDSQWRRWRKGRGLSEGPSPFSREGQVTPF